MRAEKVLWLVLASVTTPSNAQPSGSEFFEKKIRPILVEKCYACHSSTLSSPMGGLMLDTKSGMLRGGANGPAVVPGKPAESRLMKAIRYTDAKLSMPPSGKLPDSVVADIEQWILNGALDPRESASPGAPPPTKGIDIEGGRKWWAFQPVRELPVPRVKDANWSRTKIDSFILAKLEENGLNPSRPADRRTLVRRAYIDLLGLKPSYEEIEAFANDTSPEAYQRLVEQLLTSRHYGERWGRHWLDVARYGEDFAEPAIPYAWRYRDWVIEAMNSDVPYDRFIRLQLAADFLPGTSRQDLRALGYLGVAPTYHKDGRLSEEVIFTFATDDWDEKVDAISRGMLGLSVACARCHDHKFDPFLQKDYYALAGVFASTSMAQRPVFEIDPTVEARFMWIEDRLDELDQRVRYLTELPGSKPKESAEKVEKMLAEIGRLQAEMDSVKDRYPQLSAHVAGYGKNLPKPRVKDPNPLGGVRRDPGGPFMNVVYDAALYVDGSDPDLTMLARRPGEARDLPAFIRGNVSTPGEIAPRGFITVLSKGDQRFRSGSGRLELAERILTDAAPLTARVIVNRVWGWHFGRPLVTTPSDFGFQGDKPSHAELLDDLAARFIANGWSFKWLHREIMLSATYQQASHPRADGRKVDEMNTLLWRWQPRRLDIEAYRDSLLQASGNLNDAMSGPSTDLEAEANNRRTVYGRVSRQNLHTLLQLYDFPSAMQTSPARDATVTSLQQLFVMNSSFMQRQAAAMAKSLEAEADYKARLRVLYRRVLGRDPDSEEVDLGLTYLRQGTLAQYAQALLSTNEVIFWP